MSERERLERALEQARKDIDAMRGVVQAAEAYVDAEGDEACRRYDALRDSVDGYRRSA